MFGTAIAVFAIVIAVFIIVIALMSTAPWVFKCAFFFVGGWMVAKLAGDGVQGWAVYAFLVGVVLTTLSVFSVRYQHRIERLPVVDAAAFQAIGPGQDVIITGILDGNSGPGDLVAYDRQRYEVGYAETGPNTGTCTSGWKTFDQVVPALTILVDGKLVHTSPPPRLATMRGIRHTKITKQGSGKKCGGDTTDGSIRVIGYKNGDVVTFVGQKDVDGRLIPERLYGGDYAQFIESVQFNVPLAIPIGISLTLGGALYLGIVTVPRLWRVIQRGVGKDT